MKVVSKDIRIKIQEATEKVLADKKEVDFYGIKETLEREHKIKFFNNEVLQQLIKEALDNIVYICL